jgi:hypothetical protein
MLLTSGWVGSKERERGGADMEEQEENPKEPSHSYKEERD